jgi:hypothetical protein
VTPVLAVGLEAPKTEWGRTLCNEYWGACDPEWTAGNDGEAQDRPWTTWTPELPLGASPSNRVGPHLT